ncbi:MAG: glycosyltransferase family 9 protein [Fluviibacter sp.]
MTQISPNILVIRLGLLGDMVCTTPMLEAIKAHFPSGRLCLLSNEYNRPVVARNPHIDKLYTYIHTKDRQRNPRLGFFASLIDAWRLKRDLKREHFDWIVICNGGFNKPSVRIAQGLGGKIISATREDGTYEYRVDYPISDLLKEPIEHEVVRTFKLLGHLGIVSDELPPHLTLTPDESVLAETRTRLQPPPRQPIIAIHISARDPRREWSVERFADLIHEISKSIFVTFWIIHAPDDVERAHQLSIRLDGISHELIAPVDTEALIARLSLSNLVVCQEGGILHLAAGLQKPVVGLFENTTEKVLGWYPWRVNYRIVTNPVLAGLIKDIAATDVTAAVIDLYQETQHKL